MKFLKDAFRTFENSYRRENFVFHEKSKEYEEVTDAYTFRSAEQLRQHKEMKESSLKQSHNERINLLKQVANNKELQESLKQQTQKMEKALSELLQKENPVWDMNMVNKKVNEINQQFLSGKVNPENIVWFEKAYDMVKFGKTAANAQAGGVNWPRYYDGWFSDLPSMQEWGQAYTENLAPRAGGVLIGTFLINRIFDASYTKSFATMVGFTDPMVSTGVRSFAEGLGRTAIEMVDISFYIPKAIIDLIKGKAGPGDLGRKLEQVTQFLLNDGNIDFPEWLAPSEAQMIKDMFWEEIELKRKVAAKDNPALTEVFDKILSMKPDSKQSKTDIVSISDATIDEVAKQFARLAKTDTKAMIKNLERDNFGVIKKKDGNLQKIFAMESLDIAQGFLLNNPNPAVREKFLQALSEYSKGPVSIPFNPEDIVKLDTIHSLSLKEKQKISKSIDIASTLQHELDNPGGPFGGRNEIEIAIIGVIATRILSQFTLWTSDGFKKMLGEKEEKTPEGKKIEKEKEYNNKKDKAKTKFLDTLANKNTEKKGVWNNLLSHLNKMSIIDSTQEKVLKGYVKKLSPEHRKEWADALKTLNFEQMKIDSSLANIKEWQNKFWLSISVDYREKYYGEIGNKNPENSIMKTQRNDALKQLKEIEKLEEAFKKFRENAGKDYSKKEIQHWWQYWYVFTNAKNKVSKETAAFKKYLKANGYKSDLSILDRIFKKSTIFDELSVLGVHSNEISLLKSYPRGDGVRRKQIFDKIEEVLKLYGEKV